MAAFTHSMLTGTGTQGFNCPLEHSAAHQSSFSLTQATLTHQRAPPPGPVVRRRLTARRGSSCPALPSPLRLRSPPRS